MKCLPHSHSRPGTPGSGISSTPPLRPRSSSQATSADGERAAGGEGQLVEPLPHALVERRVRVEVVGEVAGVVGPGDVEAADQVDVVVAGGPPGGDDLGVQLADAPEVERAD